MISGLTRVLIKTGSTLPGIVKKGVKEVAREVITDKVINTGSNIINGTANNIMGKVIKDLDNDIKDIQNAPKDMLNEFIRNSYHEHARQPFNVNTSYNANYDYFDSYYNSNAIRYTPTPEPNLAEQFYNAEKRDRYIREQYLKSTNIY
ncbi:hypothetical protein B5F20_14645 [Clostridium perfringens]|uniref:hypothetical protein n=1 Tax=Clostridium perfringens TaxID=1502 RepID=UPI000B3A0317|nr:hypothetical protein [Clostridium perfringens]OUP40981.1 hypothetical protein B5F20_14645 [Clostridium perfringens]